jgi:hypothetical protein
MQRRETRGARMKRPVTPDENKKHFASATLRAKTARGFQAQTDSFFS